MGIGSRQSQRSTSETPAGKSEPCKPYFQFMPGDGDMHLKIGGELSLSTLPQIWPPIRHGLRRRRLGNLTLDMSHVVCRDSACLALVSEIRRRAAVAGGKVNVQGVSPALNDLLEMAALPDAKAPHLFPPKPPGLIIRLGEKVACTLAEAKAMVAFVGEVCTAFVWAVFHPRRVRWGDLAAACEKIGADAVPITLLLGLLIGVMLAFQSAEQTERYGVRTVIPAVVAIAVTRELGPLIVALLMAGRTGSSLAAELGTMKVDQELNALRAMGLDPVRFLTVPRVLAALLMAPLLCMFCDLAGVIGGYTVMAYHGMNFIHYLIQAHQSLNWPDVFGGVGKTVLEGLMIGMVGCFCGLRTGSGPRAAGDSATRSVVMSILIVVATDGCFGVIYYFMRI